MADLPTRERAVQCKFLHLWRDFSQKAFSGDMSGNSADISKGYFYKPIGGSNPLFSASKSLMLQQKISVVELSLVSARNCASWPLRERIRRALHVQYRSFLRTQLCQWLSLCE